MKKAETIGKEIEGYIESSLLESQGKEDAEEMIELWSEFISAVHHCTEERMTRISTLKDALESAILKIRGKTRFRKK